MSGWEECVQLVDAHLGTLNSTVEPSGRREITKLRFITTTADVAKASSNSRIIVTIGDEDYTLNEDGRNDFQAGDTNDFTFDVYGLTVSRLMESAIKLRNEGKGKSPEWKGDTLYVQYMPEGFNEFCSLRAISPIGGLGQVMRRGGDTPQDEDDAPSRPSCPHRV